MIGRDGGGEDDQQDADHSGEEEENMCGGRRGAHKTNGAKWTEEGTRTADAADDGL